MTYSASGLPSGLSINSSTGLISGTIASGDSSNSPYAITVTANDGTSSSSQTFAWNIAVVNLASPGDQNNNDGDTVSLPLTTGYHGSGTLSYSATGLPAGLSINSSTGQITGTISDTADTNSPYSVTVTATDHLNTSSQTFNWTVNPVVTVDSIDDQNNAAGNSVSLQVSASDANNSTLTYSATGLPSGLAINSTTGLISGTIAVGDDVQSPYAATVTATDSAGQSASQSFNWYVSHVALADPGPQTSINGAQVQLQLQGSDADGDTVTYTAAGLPPGLSISSSGLISGTVASNADTNSPYAVTVTANDSHGNTMQQSFSWTVSQVSLTAPSNQTNSEGDTVSLQLQGAASTGTLAYNANGLPPGLSLNTTTGLISGTIAAGDAANGPYTVDVSASNAADSTSQSFSWTVNPIVNLTAPTDQSNVEGNSVSLQLTASDSKNATLSYSASGLPPGLSINSNSGLISGTISSGDSANGPYIVTVTAGDGTYSSSATFMWTVTHTDTTALTITNPGTQVNVAGDSVNLPISASDPDGIDTLTYSAVGLPDGLDIDPSSGIISGTVADDAVMATPYSVTVTADDGNGQTARQTFTMIVNAPSFTATGSSFNAVVGNDSGSVTVASFTTPDLNSEAGDFTATINYGDGTTDTGTVSGSNGSFTVSGDHTYMETGNSPVSVAINDNLTGTSTQVSTTASVADAAMTLYGGFQMGDPLTDSQGTFLVAALQYGNPYAQTSNFPTIRISWGDGISSPGQLVSKGDGLFMITGQHGYPNLYPNIDLQEYAVTVTVQDAAGTSATTTDTVVVGQISSVVLGKMAPWLFQDQNVYAPASDFLGENQRPATAEINYGDNVETFKGNVATGPGNGSGGYTYYSITPDLPHGYAQDSLSIGKYQIQESFDDDDGNSLTGKQYTSVTRPPLTLSTMNVATTPPNILTLNNVQLGTITVPDVYDTASEFSATIYWGDGSSSSGVITGGGGTFSITGSHTYKKVGVYPVRVDVTQYWSTGLILASTGLLVAQVGVPNVRLYSVTYEGNDGITLANDKTTIPYGIPQWLDRNMNGVIDPGDHQYPYAYVSGKVMTIKAVFKPLGFVQNPNQIQIEGTVEGTTPNAEPSGVVNASIGPIVANLQRGVYIIDTTITLPSVTVDIPWFRLIWRYSPNNGNAWLPAGENENHLYLTYKSMTPRGDQLVPDKLQTVFQDATSTTPFDDHGTPMDLLDSVIWGHFAPLNATRALDGDVLQYYNNWQTLNTTYEQLVSIGDGQCGSWAQLLAAAILADGLDGTGGWTVRYDTFYSATIPPQNTATGFLINSWRFAPGGVNTNFLSFIGLNSYNWTPGKAVQAQDSPGIRGQNVDDPLSMFNNHQVIELGVGGSIHLFDPSYGAAYEASDLNAALQLFQDQAIAAFYTQSTVNVNGKKVLKLSIAPNRRGNGLNLTSEASGPL